LPCRASVRSAPHLGSTEQLLGVVSARSRFSAAPAGLQKPGVPARAQAIRHVYPNVYSYSK